MKEEMGTSRKLRWFHADNCCNCTITHRSMDTVAFSVCVCLDMAVKKWEKWSPFVRGVVVRYLAVPAVAAWDGGMDMATRCGEGGLQVDKAGAELQRRLG